MIEGVKLSFSGGELVNHCQEKVSYHKEKAKFYREKTKELQNAGYESDHSGNPLDEFKRKVEEHEENKQYFLILVDHIVLAETYILTLSDLKKLEIITKKNIY